MRFPAQDWLSPASGRYRRLSVRKGKKSTIGPAGTQDISGNAAFREKGPVTPADGFPERAVYILLHPFRGYAKRRQKSHHYNIMKEMRMKPQAPDYIRSIKPYKPGKPIEELEREYGIKNSIKLASNENPLGPSPRAMAAMHAAMGNLHRYPDGSG
jgi:hypothetical protein